jgi:hypothetical protein
MNDGAWYFTESLVDEVVSRLVAEFSKDDCCFKGIPDIDALLLIWVSLSLHVLENLLHSIPSHDAMEKLLLIQNQYILNAMYVTHNESALTH